MHLILGTANWARDGYGKRLEKDECFKILDQAKALGIKTVATAFDYGIEVVREYGWEDVLHKCEPWKISWNGASGVTLDRIIPGTSLLVPTLLMAPLNPLDYSFLPISNHRDVTFIARSIFCGGKLQRSNKEDVARLCFGFLKSHDVKNAVFGVESIEELELNVRIANEK